MRGICFSGALSIAFLIITGCSTVTVETDYDQSAAFDHYSTYRLAPPPNGPALSPSGEAALRESLLEGLGALGIREIQDGMADLDVVWHVFTRDRLSVQQYVDWGYTSGGPWPDRYGSYRMWGGAPMTYTDVNNYIEGTLILDFVDTGSTKLVFRGVGTGVVGSPRANAKNIREAVRKIIRDFPVE